ncbi:MAG: sigma-70 family RNA polymerase sigma factor [Oscillospiraceae bacterium]|nr:sigma-70 family RNA polymerase sigma factor [Oscillospiraceae bacterium]
MRDAESIYREYAVPVYRFAYTLTGNADAAEELTQDTFCEAVRCLHRYDGSCKLLTWLCQIARHRWYDTLKKRRRYTDTPPDETLTDPAPGPQQLAESGEEVRRLYRYIHELPAQEKELVLLRILAQLPFAEIAAILGCSENAARVKYHRARQKLKERMEQDG